MLKVVVFAVVVLCSLAVAVYTFGFAFNSKDQFTKPYRGPRAVDTLKFIIIISRHGNRGTAYDYPGDPYPINDKMYWPYGPDNLTPRGRGQVYRLGQKVRSLYSGYIPEMYDTDDILSRSTYLNRLLMSGEGFLAGLYPPMGRQVWDSDIDWQPTALYSDSPDRSLEVNVNCNIFKAHFQSTLVQISNKYKFHELFIRSFVKSSTGENTTALNEFSLWDKLSCEVNEGYDIPDWAQTIYPSTLLPYIEEQYTTAWAGTDEIVRLVVGEMYEQMLTAMKQKVNGSLTPDMKVLYYSGHDTSIIALQRLLGVSPQSMVGMVRPASALIIELHQDATTNKHYLEAVFLNGANLDRGPRPLNITADFSSLVNNTQKFLHVNYAEECK